ncbi:A24 family peptidase [Vulcanococcus sp. Clear-D1]|uniref:prepilin peptidase n=1 Tax=Vulcanococcus sp. Clear-D1 TaxID=2766970 RepID=UPI001988E0E7|nr:A24 family peptidase [Vulcanococcus sp. Clear-D1]MBD1193411.1 prepilin peptidase [Vulcanococcus sp. Clear-D1]
MQPPLSPELALLAALLGACIGSFLNVVAWRLPRQESVVRPRSHCPRCGTTLRWFENIPVLSWLLLRGRCRHCGTAIAVQYPAVELLCSGLFVAAAAAPAAVSAAGSSLAGAPAWLVVLAGWLLISLLLPMVLIDLDQLWLPEPLCRWGVVLGLVVSAIAGFSQGDGPGRELLLWHLLAASAGLLGFEATSALAQKLLGKPALGLGDAKLAALLGAWLGLTGLGLTVMLSVFGGALLGVIGLLSGRLKRGQPFPFGPFLAGAGLAVWCAGNSFWLQRFSLWLGWGAL